MANTWFRFYSEALNDPKVQSLPPELFKHWVNILCIACDGNGLLPQTLRETSFMLRLPEEDARSVVDRLRIAGLIDTMKGGAIGSRIAPHSWGKRQYKSDTSTERVKRFRNGERNVSETPPDTDTDTDTDTDKIIPKGITKKPIKKNPHFEEFWEIYPRQRRGSREKTEAAYRQALSKAPPEIILDGLKSYVDSDEVSQGFAKGAAAWLNDDRWTVNYAFTPQSAPCKTDLALQEAAKRYGITN